MVLPKRVSQELNYLGKRRKTVGLVGTAAGRSSGQHGPVTREFGEGERDLVPRMGNNDICPLRSQWCKDVGQEPALQERAAGRMGVLSSHHY